MLFVFGATCMLVAGAATLPRARRELSEAGGISRVASNTTQCARMERTTPRRNVLAKHCECAGIRHWEADPTAWPY